MDLGIDFIQNATAKQAPFYLNLWFHISHAPLNLLKEQLANFSMTKFCPWSGMTPDLEDFSGCPEQVFRAAQHDADTHIGRMLDFLHEKGLDKNTVSDQMLMPHTFETCLDEVMFLRTNSNECSLQSAILELSSICKTNTSSTLMQFVII